MRLRAILTLAMAAVGGVAVAVAIVLIAVTSAMSQAGLALDRLRRQIDRLESMVGDLMDRTRIEAGQFELHLTRPIASSRSELPCVEAARGRARRDASEYSGCGDAFW